MEIQDLLNKLEEFYKYQDTVDYKVQYENNDNKSNELRYSLFVNDQLRVSKLKMTDFKLLRKTLIKRCLNSVIIPALPEEYKNLKKKLLSKDLNLIKEQTASVLTHWMNFLSKHPYIAQTKTFKLFITSKEESFEKSLKTMHKEHINSPNNINTNTMSTDDQNKLST